MKKLLSIIVIVTLILVTPIISFGADNSGKCAVYLHFNNVMTDEGFKNFDYTTQYLSYGTGWNFTKKKLDNFITCKTYFEYEGDEYTFTGNWLYEDGSEVIFPVSVKPVQGQTEIHITVIPEYDVQVVKHLTVERIDPIRNTNASASNENKVTSYTHKFENPDDLGILENYKFLGWLGENKLVQPGESVTWLLSDFNDKYNTIIYIAQYQPSVTVNWYVNNELFSSDSSFDCIESNKLCTVKGFKSWVTESGEKAEDIYYANGVNEESKIISLYADIEEQSEDDTKVSLETSLNNNNDNSINSKTISQTAKSNPKSDIHKVESKVIKKSTYKTFDEDLIKVLISLILMFCSAFILLSLLVKGRENRSGY